MSVFRVMSGPIVLAAVSTVMSVAPLRGAMAGVLEEQAAPAPVYYPPTAAPNGAPTAPTAPTGPEESQMTDQQLDQLLGPIALYPDALVAPVLTGSMFPLDVVSAQQWLRANPSPSEDAINAQPWDPSIKILLHYPTVMDQLAGNVAWTQQLGEAFHDQPQAVMTSIQRLRARAAAAGHLASTPQETVATVDGAITILPTSPSEIYVPIYDAGDAYVAGGGGWWGSPVVSFSPGYAIGDWLDFGCDWYGYGVYTGAHWDRRGERHDIRPPRNAPRWQPAAHRPIQISARFSPAEIRGYDRGPERSAAPFRPEAARGAVERQEQRGMESQRQPPRQAPARPQRPPEPARPEPSRPEPARPEPRQEPSRPSAPPARPGRGRGEIPDDVGGSRVAAPDAPAGAPPEGASVAAHP
jgi:hypothetical protein